MSTIKKHNINSLTNQLILYISLILLLTLTCQNHYRYLQFENYNINSIILSGTQSIQSSDIKLINYGRSIQVINDQDIVLVFGIIKYQSINNTKGFNLSVTQKTRHYFKCQGVSNTKITIRYIVYSKNELRQTGLNSYQEIIFRNNVTQLQQNQTSIKILSLIDQNFTNLNLIKINHFIHGVLLNQVIDSSINKNLKIYSHINKQTREFTIQIISKQVQAFTIQIYLFEMKSIMQNKNAIRNYQLYSQSLTKNMPTFQKKIGQQGNQILWQESKQVQTIFCSTGQNYLLYGISNMDISNKMQIMPHKFQIRQIYGLGVGKGLSLQTKSRKHDEGQLKQSIWIQFASITLNEKIQNRNGLTENSQYITGLPLKICPSQKDYHYIQIILSISVVTTFFSIIFLIILLYVIKKLLGTLQKISKRYPPSIVAQPING